MVKHQDNSTYDDRNGRFSSRGYEENNQPIASNNNISWISKGNENIVPK